MKAIKGIIKAANVVVMISIIVVMLLTVADVLLRWILNVSIIGVTEYTQILMAIILLSTGATALHDGHIKVDIVMNHCSPRVQNICGTVALLLSLFISAMLTSSIFYEGVRAFQRQLKFTTLQIVKYPFYFAYALAMAVLCLSIVVLLIAAVRRLCTHEQ